MLLLGVHALPTASGESAPARVISIDAARIAAARAAFRAEHGRAPDEAETRALIAAEIDDEILFREALALGLADFDTVVQQRLAGNLAFVEHGDPSVAIRGAGRSADLTADLVERDLVVRRRLIERMRARLEADAVAAEPREDELRQALANEPERFALPARVRVEYAPVGDAVAASEPPASSVRALPPSSARELPTSSARDLERAFGPEFARTAFTIEPGHWSAPVATPSGSYRLLVRERIAPRVPSLDAVRNQVRAAVLRERAATAARRALDELRASYAVTVASPHAATDGRG